MNEESRILSLADWFEVAEDGLFAPGTERLTEEACEFVHFVRVVRKSEFPARKNVSLLTMVRKAIDCCTQPHSTNILYFYHTWRS